MRTRDNPWNIIMDFGISSGFPYEVSLAEAMETQDLLSERSWPPNYLVILGEEIPERR
jgi:hypothetical protein